MKRAQLQIALGCVAVSLALSAPASAQKAAANSYPTADRVEYVLECMQRNGGKQEYLYKCSCVIDQIATKLGYDDFIEGATVARFQSLGGDRGGVFRDPPQTKAVGKRYSQIQSDAKKRCDVAN